MELFSRLDESEAADCYAKARIRYVVFEEWHKMITHLDKLGCLKVIDTQEEYPSPSTKTKPILMCLLTCLMYQPTSQILIHVLAMTIGMVCCSDPTAPPCA